MAAGVTVDLTGFSVSFNEYLRLISIRRRMDPDEDTLTEVLRLFDPHNTGQIEEDQFRKILSSKQGITEEDIEEMIAGTYIPKVSYSISSCSRVQKAGRGGGGQGQHGQQRLRHPLQRSRPPVLPLDIFLFCSLIIFGQRENIFDWEGKEENPFN